MSEFNVFLATMRWVDADKSREQFLDEILSLIRFPTMDYEELGLVGKQPTAAGAVVLKVCPTPQHREPNQVAAAETKLILLNVVELSILTRCTGLS